jgi:putative restriction endonuclease
MIGWVAPTDFDWYSFLAGQGSLEEVNFWRPSASRQSKADLFSPFLFKLKAPHNAICGFGFFAGYSALPIWLAWEAFGIANGCQNRAIMNSRIEEIRRRIGYHDSGPSDQIGCILIVNPVFFSKDEWIPQPRDWPPANLIAMRYDLENGEGQRIWLACLERASHRGPAIVASDAPRFGSPSLIRPRLGQGTFRISVTDAYGRACAVTNEHSLPALEAAHIRPYTNEGPHNVQNGLLLRADFHRLFDQGYVTVSPDLRLQVSRRLREDYENGRTYYPFDGHRLNVPADPRLRPDPDYLVWHNANVYNG